MKPEEMLEIINAHLEGKQIEYRFDSSDKWLKCQGVPSFNFADTEYRIAPQERKFLCFMMKSGELRWFLSTSNLAVTNVANLEGFERIPAMDMVAGALK